MPLPSSGPISFGDIAREFLLDEGEGVRWSTIKNIVDAQPNYEEPTGLLDMFGKEYVVRITVPASNLLNTPNMLQLLTDRERLSPNVKRITLSSGIVGNSNTSAYAVYADGEWFGNLELQNQATIIGAGGTLSSPNGGGAIYVNKTNTHPATNFNVINSGIIYAGGGAGAIGPASGEGEGYIKFQAGIANVAGSHQLSFNGLRDPKVDPDGIYVVASEFTANAAVVFQRQPGSRDFSNIGVLVDPRLRNTTISSISTGANVIRSGPHVFVRNGANSWAFRNTITYKGSPSANINGSSDSTPDGRLVVVGLSTANTDAGALYLAKANTNFYWEEIANVKLPYVLSTLRGRLGNAVAISDDGNVILAGEYTAYVSQSTMSNKNIGQVRIWRSVDGQWGSGLGTQKPAVSEGQLITVANPFTGNYVTIPSMGMHVDIATVNPGSEYKLYATVPTLGYTWFTTYSPSGGLGLSAYLTGTGPGASGGPSVSSICTGNSGAQLFRAHPYVTATVPPGTAVTYANAGAILSQFSGTILATEPGAGDRWPAITTAFSMECSQDGNVLVLGNPVNEVRLGGNAIIKFPRQIGSYGGNGNGYGQVLGGVGGIPTRVFQDPSDPNSKFLQGAQGGYGGKAGANGEPALGTVYGVMASNDYTTNDAATGFLINGSTGANIIATPPGTPGYAGRIITGSVGNIINTGVMLGLESYPGANVDGSTLWFDSINNSSIVIDWTVPSNIYLISVLCIGGGGCGGYAGVYSSDTDNDFPSTPSYSEVFGSTSYGSPDRTVGAVTNANRYYRNDIPVTPGEILTITVGGASAATLSSDVPAWSNIWDPDAMFPFQLNARTYGWVPDPGRVGGASTVVRKSTGELLLGASGGLTSTVNYVTNAAGTRITDVEVSAPALNGGLVNPAGAIIYPLNTMYGYSTPGVAAGVLTARGMTSSANQTAGLTTKYYTGTTRRYVALDRTFSRGSGGAVHIIYGKGRQWPYGWAY